MSSANHIYVSFVLHCIGYGPHLSANAFPQMLGENLLAKFKKTPMAITAMRALKGESVGAGFVRSVGAT